MPRFVISLGLGRPAGVLLCGHGGAVCVELGDVLGAEGRAGVGSMGYQGKKDSLTLYSFRFSPVFNPLGGADTSR